MKKLVKKFIKEERSGMSVRGVLVLGAVATVITFGISATTGNLPTRFEKGQLIAQFEKDSFMGAYDDQSNEMNRYGFGFDGEQHQLGDKLFMIENTYGETMFSWEIGHEKTISETFKITEVGPQIKGEPINKTGEGINYVFTKFIDFGYQPNDNVKVGDEFKITWLKSDYERSNWDNIAKITKMN